MGRPHEPRIECGGPEQRHAVVCPLHPVQELPQVHEVRRAPQQQLSRSANLLAYRLGTLGRRRDGCGQLALFNGVDQLRPAVSLNAAEQNLGQGDVGHARVVGVGVSSFSVQ